MKKEDLKAGYLLEVIDCVREKGLRVIMPIVYEGEETLAMVENLEETYCQEIKTFDPFQEFEVLAVYGLPTDGRHKVWKKISKEGRPLLWEKPKKVFRLWKYLESQVKKVGYKSLAETLIFMKNVSSNWIYKCDGVTVEDCHKLGYLIEEEWLVEEEFKF
jgi:hypothetical protein